MLELEPTHWFSWAFAVADDGKPLGTFDISAWRERGDVTVAGQAFTVARKGFMGADFRFESGGTVVATATKPGVFTREFVLTFSGRTLHLRARSVWGKALALMEGDREVGDVRPRGMWTRRATATLPDTLPLPVRLFVLWLAVLLWKRDDEAAASASG